MRLATSPEVFRHAPVGRFAITPSSLLWCASPTLAGVVVWGAPDERETRQITSCLDGFLELAPSFDVLLDGRQLTRIDPAALEVLLAWARMRFGDLSQRLRRRIGVIPRGILGLTLAGITPVLGGPGPDLIVPTPRDGFRSLLPDGGGTGDALCDEVERLASAARDMPPWLTELRSLLDAAQGSLPLADAARRLSMSCRTLQRSLAGRGSSYRGEQHHARFRAADALLTTDEKIVSIAARLGLTEAGLNLLVRRRTGLTPGAYRRQLARSLRGLAS